MIYTKFGIMFKHFVFLFALMGIVPTYSQDSFFEGADSLNKKRFIGTSIGIGGAWAGSMIGLSQIWYTDIKKTKWHAFDDSRNWLQMDKAGHFYSAYKLTQLTTESFEWTGLKKKRAIFLGAVVGMGYQTTLEFLDAFSSDWGWSWTDATANTLGTIGYSAQKIIWDEERIIPKFSYAPTEFATVRPSVLGSTFAESMMKDYNGQTYWLSFSPGTFFKNSKIPEWACVSLGYSAHEKLVGSEPYYLDPDTGLEYYEQREFLLSLDIDFSRIPVKRPWVRVLLKQLNYLKIPFPALVLRDGRILGSAFGY